jgi:hypothetical protein
MKIKRYVEFIREARRRGFGDLTIRNELVNKGWPLNEINLAFNYVKTLDEISQGESMKESDENKVTIYMDDDLLNKLDKRARKNMLSLPEQIEDILRRSTLNQKNKKGAGEKLDDNLVGLFSRKRTGPKSRKHKKRHARRKQKKEIKEEKKKARKHRRKIIKEEKKVKRKSRRHKKKEE